MKQTTISKVKKGEYFTLVPSDEPKETQVWVRGDYEPSTKKYEVFKFSDVCHTLFVKGTRKCFIDFYF